MIIAVKLLQHMQVTNEDKEIEDQPETENDTPPPPPLTVAVKG